ncbi:hypothetical protein BHE74_00007133 [Ensete ventricosum]|nr:hypothetical protein GW17_00028675 [Ensete ventricosum]RWW84263.1 hypothetical protein BHE74_00007133 [Ensete ventricosum]RZR85783.1 hypothetical protein BHM03_00012821 [Ensete ventricosum]
MYISNINLTCVQKIEEAAEKGELTELVLMVIWNRLDLARKDVWADEKDVIRSLDLLYRRIEHLHSAVPPPFFQHQGRIGLPPEDDDVLLRVDFVREVDLLLQEVRAEQQNFQPPEGFDPEAVAARLRQQEKQTTIQQVEALLELAISLKW